MSAPALSAPAEAYDQIMGMAIDDPAIAAAVQRVGVELILAEAALDRVSADTINTYLRDAASAKTMMKNNKNGWSWISTNQLKALSFLAEIFLVDVEIDRATPPPKTRQEAL